MKLSLDVLKGAKEMPDRAATDQYFEQDAAARAVLYEVWSKP